VDGMCPVNEIIENNENGVQFTNEELSPATDYIVNLIPLYKGEKLQTSDEAFTRDISTLMNLDGLSVSGYASADEYDTVHVSWQEVVGADEYEVHQQYGADQEVQLVMKTDKLSVVVEQDTCTTATYALTAIRRGQASETIVYSQEITTFINDTEPYMASGLNIDMDETKTTINWKHLGSCIARYSLFFNDDKGAEYDPIASDSAISVSTEHLENCKSYRVTIVPHFINGDEWQAEPEVQQEIKRLDDAKCVIPKVPRNAKSMKQLSPTSNITNSSLSFTGSGPVVLLVFLISVILRDS